MPDPLTRYPDGTFARPGLSVGDPVLAQITTYPKPTTDEIASMPDERFTVRVNGNPTWVHYTPRGDTAAVSSDANGVTIVEIEAKSNHPAFNSLTKADVYLQQENVWPSPQPASKTLNGNKLTVVLPSGFHGNMAVVFNGMYSESVRFSYNCYPYQLGIGILPEETWKPTPSEVTHYFAAGKVYTGGEIWLGSGDTVYIEGGALVRRRLRTQSNPSPRLTNLRVGGRGVIDQHSVYDNSTFGLGATEFSNCDGVIFEGITTVSSANWNIVPFNSTDIQIRWIRMYGCEVQTGVKTTQGTPDGLDPVASSDIEWSNSFASVCDDTTAIKCAKYHGDGNVNNFIVRDQLWLQGGNGNGSDIGYELGDATHTVSNVKYQRVRMPIAWHISNSPFRHSTFGIHVPTAATVDGVIFEDCQVDRITNKNYVLWCGTFYYSGGLGSVAGTQNRGKIRNVTYRRVKWPAPASIKIADDGKGLGDWYIGNQDGGTQVSGITFDNSYHGTNKITASHAASLGSNWDVNTSDGVTFI